jgi:hypothetical protein
MSMQTRFTDEEVRAARRAQLARLRPDPEYRDCCYFCGSSLEARTTVTVRRPAFAFLGEPAVEVTACLTCWRLDGTGEMLLQEVEGEFIPLASRATTVRQV